MTLTLLIAAILSIGTGQPQPSAQTRPAPPGLTRDLFAMDTATKDARHQDYESQVRMVKELGYSGWAPSGTENVPEMLKALDAAGLPMVAIYVGVNLDPDAPKYDPKLKETIGQLKGRGTILWVYVTSKQHKPSSTDGDERAAVILGEIADMAKAADLRVAIYPHTAFYVEKVADAVRLAEKTGRRNVGVTFNLCHWLKAEAGKELEPTLRQALPHLFVVTLNGAEREGTDWDRLIQPLGKGDYDVSAVLQVLHRLGYKGPIGFQGYGIKGDLHAVLEATMKAWRSYSARLPAVEKGTR